MQIIKPMQQGIVFRTFSKDRRFYLSVASLSFFPFHNPLALGTEQQMWETINAHLGAEMILDAGMPKCQGEVLVVGKCCAPAGEPVTRHFVDLDIGSIRKRLVVTGNRYWRRGNSRDNMFLRVVGNDWRASSPEPFEVMDIGWTNAFGGDGYSLNPLGKGFLPKGVDPGYYHDSPLPNIESTNRMIPEDWSIADVYDKFGIQYPAGYGPIDVSWPQREGKVGKKYDKHWEDKLYPEPAEDMDPTYYNMAPVDQQLEKTLFNGNETFSITGMHPDDQCIQSRLPQIVPRCFAQQKHEAGEHWSEISMHPETVWLFPNVQRGVLIHRGIFEINTFYGVDVNTLLLAWELKDGETRTPQDYRASLERRENEETAPEWSIREDDLSPPEGIPEEESIFLDEDEASPSDKLQPIVDRANSKVSELLGKAKDMILAAGLNPADLLPAAPVALTLPVLPKFEKMSDIGKVMDYAAAEEKKLDAQTDAMMKESKYFSKTKQEAEKKIKDRAREICKQCGQDFDELYGKAKPPSTKPTMARFTDILENAKIQLAAHPDKVLGLDAALGTMAAAQLKMDKAMADIGPTMEAMDRESAHYDEAPEIPSAERQRELRAWAQCYYDEGKSFENLDLTGIDLSGMKFTGACFKGAKLDSALLQNSDFSEADFSEAILARADFTDSMLVGANFEKAGLGKTVFHRTDLRKSNLNEATFDQTVVTDSFLVKSTMRLNMCLQSNFSNSDLSEVDLSETEIMESSFVNTKFFRANVFKTSFMTCKMFGAHFLEANCEETKFVEVDATSCVFDLANMKNANAHLDSDFSKSSFLRIKGDDLNFAQTKLCETVFTGAELGGADFSESSMLKANFNEVVARKASFTDADLTQATFVGADLMQSSLQGALLTKTVFYSAHLFGADFMFSQLDETQFHGAIIKRTNLDRGWF